MAIGAQQCSFTRNKVHGNVSGAAKVALVLCGDREVGLMWLAALPRLQSIQFAVDIKMRAREGKWVCRFGESGRCLAFFGFDDAVVVSLTGAIRKP